MPDVSPVEQLLAENAALRAEVVGLRAENAKLGELRDLVAVLTERVAELERERAVDSSNSSRPPSSDAPWMKKPAKKRSSRTRSGRKPGKQPGASSSSRSLIDDPDDRLVIRPDRCRRCDASLVGAQEHSRQRRQVVDVCPPPPPKVTEYQRISTRCGCCGAVTTPGWDDPAVPVEHAQTLAAPGSPVRIGPEALARAALLSCARYLPIGRSRDLLETLTAIEVWTGLLAGIRGRAARRLWRASQIPDTGPNKVRTRTEGSKRQNDAESTHLSLRTKRRGWWSNLTVRSLRWPVRSM